MTSPVWRNEERKKRLLSSLGIKGRGLVQRHCVQICEQGESRGLCEGLQVDRHWLLKITAMTSSSLCRLRHKTQPNETREGEKTWMGGGERGGMSLVRDVVIAMSFVGRGRGGRCWGVGCMVERNLKARFKKGDTTANVIFCVKHDMLN